MPDTVEPIENHGIIGDMHTVALVAMDGTIDFLCMPHFDSPSVFVGLLDPKRGGSFEIAPQLEHANRKQLYLPDSNVLLTRSLAKNGVAEISDFMPIHPHRHVHRIVRRVKCVRGEVAFRMRCAPRFDYARAGHRVEKNGETVVFQSEGAERQALRL